MLSRINVFSLFYPRLGKSSLSRWEISSYIIIIICAAGLRFWDLGSITLHHDESIHAFWSWQLAFDGHYIHDPVFHGPFYYFLQAATFIIFQDSDYTARLSAAFFGIFLTALPLMLRRWLGPVGTIAAMAFIAFSPSLVYYSRFFRGDIYVAVFTLCMVIAVWRYLATGRHRWLYVLSASLVGIFLTKEMAYLEAAIILLSLNALFSGDLASMTFPNSRKMRTAFVLVLMPFSWIIAVLWPVIGMFRERAGWKSFPRSGDLLVLLGTLVLPLLIAFLRDPLELGFPGIRDLSIFQSIPFIGRGVVSIGSLSQEVVCSGPISDRIPIIISLLVVGGLATISGLLWKPKVWLTCALLASFVYATFMSTFWTNVDGLCTGLWGSLDYWRDQQAVKRGNQPWFYYLMLVPGYDFLPLALAIPGLVWSFLRRDYFARFLAFWLIAMFFALSIAGEKMPWLTVHIVLPATLLAGWFIHSVWIFWQDSPKKGNLPGALFCIALLCTVSVIVFPVAIYVQDLFIGIRICLAIFPFVVLLICIRRFSFRALPFFVTVLVMSALVIFSLRTMTGVTFTRGDIPKDLLIYTQSAPHLKDFDDRIDRILKKSDSPDKVLIAIDNKESFAWPWVWYLRDFPGIVHYSNHAEILNFEKNHYTVILSNSGNAAVVRSELSRLGLDGNYHLPESYPHRWWFPETYKAPFTRIPSKGLSNSRYYTFGEFETWQIISSNLFTTSGSQNWFSVMYFFWRDHEPSDDLGSVDGVAWFLKDENP